MYPKKKYYDDRKWSGQIELNKGFNQCHDQMTQEIKKRANVGELIDVMVETHEIPLTKEQADNINIYAQAISTHITEGLE